MRLGLNAFGLALVAGVTAGVALAWAAVPGEGMGTSTEVAVPGDAPAAVAGAAATAAPSAAAIPTPSCTPAPLAERAGRVLVVGLPGVTDPDDPLIEEVMDVGVGGILLTKTNVDSEEQVAALVEALRRRADRPLVISTDEEPGRVSSFGELIGRSSSARTMAARDEPEDVRAFAADLGAELAGFDVDLALGPVVDLDDGPAQSVIGDRSFSADADEASAYALAFTRGLADAGVMAAPKHFPGHGRSTVDSHATASTVEVELDELAATDLVPFAEQITEGVPVVMLGHVAYEPLDPELPASLAPSAYALLRDLGFSGVAMTDSLGMGAVHRRWAFPESAVLSVTAGADAALTTDGNQARAMRDALVAAVEAGDLPQARLDEAVARMSHLAGADPAGIVCVDVEFPELTS